MASKDVRTCERCGCRRSNVVYTRLRFGGKVARSRQCPQCGRRWITYEIAAPVSAYDRRRAEAQQEIAMKKAEKPVKKPRKSVSIPADKKVPKPEGNACPKCFCADAPTVARKNDAAGRIMHRRKCRNCGHEFTTPAAN